MLETVLVIIIIGIQPLGRFGQRPELSWATGMTLVCCILGKFLGVVCHCFPPFFVIVEKIRDVVFDSLEGELSGKMSNFH